MMVRRILENKWAMFFFIAFIYFARNYFRFFDNALWAEDGKIFLAQAYTYGLKSILMPYNGYLHITIRVLALILSKLSLLVIPFFYHISAYFLMIYTVYIIINSRLRLSNISKNFLGLTLATVSSSNSSGIGREIFIILTNVQWFTCFILICHILEEYDEKIRLLPIFHAIAFGLQGPFSILLAPLALLKAIYVKEKNKSYWIFTLIISVAGIVQYTLSRIRLSHNVHIRPVLWLHELFVLFFNYMSFFTILYVILIVVVVIELYNRKFMLNMLEIVFLNIFALISMLSGFRLMGFVFSPEMIGRYFFIAYVLFNWCLVYIASLNCIKRIYINCAKLLIIIGLFYTCKYFFIPKNDSYNWKNQVENYQIDRKYQFTVPPGSDSWKFILIEN